MSKHILIACDGGALNTLTGSGGLYRLTIDDDPEMKHEDRLQENYIGSAYNKNASAHSVEVSPNKTWIVWGFANNSQLLITRYSDIIQDVDSSGFVDDMKLRFDGFYLDFYDGDYISEEGADRATAMLEFYDDDSFITQYNKVLYRIFIRESKGKIETHKKVYCDLPKYFNKVNFVHQISVTEKFVVADDALSGRIYVVPKDDVKNPFELGDGYTSGHHTKVKLAYETVYAGDKALENYKDAYKEDAIIRPSFNFYKNGAVKLSANSLSVYFLESRKLKSIVYEMDVPLHSPVDIFYENNYVFIASVIPGSIMKINLSTGDIENSIQVRPNILTRFLGIFFDFTNNSRDFGAFNYNKEETPFDIHRLIQSVEIALMSGTRGGFFSLVNEEKSSSDRPNCGKENDKQNYKHNGFCYAAHRGLNRIYKIRKHDLSIVRRYKFLCFGKIWPHDIKPKKRFLKLIYKPMNLSLLIKWLYDKFGYVSQGLGVHHGTLVKDSGNEENI